MVDEKSLFVAGFIVLALFSAALLRYGRDSGGRPWAAAWVCLYAAGGAAALANHWSVFLPLYPLLGTSFAALLYVGTCRYTEQPIPAALLPAFGVVVGIRVLAQPFVGDVAHQAGGSAAIIASCLASTVLVLRDRRPATSGRLTLTAAFLSTGIASATYAVVHASPDLLDTGRFVWLIAGTLGSGMQTLALQERVAIRANAERSVLASLIESIPMGLAFAGRDGQISMMNQAFAKQLDEESRSALGGATMDAVSEQLGFDAGSEEARHPAEIRVDDGRILQSHLHPVPGRDGSPLGHLWFLNDVTTERSVHDRLERARRLELIADLAGGVAHDFNNHLTTVIGNAALIRESVRPNGQWEGPLEDLESAAFRCASLTRDLLDFSHRGHRLPVAIDLGVRLPELGARLRTKLPEGQRLLVTLEPELPPILADRRQLERALENLVSNASQAIAGDGTIEVSASTNEDGSIRLAVGDDGVGMNAAVRERAFDPFFTTKAEGRGTGLGLAIVHGIASGHGAEVQLESGPSEGTTVTLDWPAAPSEEAPA